LKRKWVDGCLTFFRWSTVVPKPFFALPYYAQWALLAIVLGSVFGFPIEEVSISRFLHSYRLLIFSFQGTNTTLGDRAISVLDLFVFQSYFWVTSKSRSLTPWPTVIISLFFQQAIALFVLKSDAGFKIFQWVANLAKDFPEQAVPAAGFFFDTETTAKHWYVSMKSN